MTELKLLQPPIEKLTNIAELLLIIAEPMNDKQTSLKSQLCTHACIVIDYLLNPVCTINQDFQDIVIDNFPEHQEK